MQVLIAAKANMLINSAKAYFKDALVECDAWFVVLLAVIMTLAFTISAGLMIWCLTYKGKTFTGNWHWSLSGVSVKVECK